jgi:tetratricopeptide (TPR) repeat protein
MMRTPTAPASALAAFCIVIAACSTVATDGPAPVPSEARNASAERSAAPLPSFEQAQRERAMAFMRQRRLADAAIAWEVLVVLRPEGADYRERLADVQRQIAAAVAERLPLAAQAAQRGDSDAATQQYLAILALQPANESAADALRALERERNKRNYLGKYSRVTITRRSVAEAEMAGTPGQRAGRNDVEHAALLANNGELDDAIALLEHRLVIDRRDAAARRLLADLYARRAEAVVTRDRPGAIAALEKSVRLDPTVPTVVARLKQLKGGAVATATAGPGAP